MEPIFTYWTLEKSKGLWSFEDGVDYDSYDIVKEKYEKYKEDHAYVEIFQTDFYRKEDSTLEWERKSVERYLNIK